MTSVNRTSLQWENLKPTMSTEGKAPISIIIPTLNEEQNLRELLPTLHWAKEIIIIDSYSTDNTKTIAQRYQVQWLERYFDTPSKQRNFAMDHCTFDWVLMLDADERPDNTMIKHIIEIVTNTENQPKFWAYKATFKHWFLGKEIRFSGWRNQKIPRLIARKFCRYADSMVHEKLTCPENRFGLLDGHILHFTCRELNYFVHKQNHYAFRSAIDHHEKTGKITMYHLWLKPAFRFFKHYFIGFGFLDGIRGYIISKLMAKGVWLRYIYLWEYRQRLK